MIEPVVSFQFLGLANHEGLARTFRGRSELDRRILDALKKSSYIVGNEFTAADILIASMGQWSRDMLPKDQIIDSYLERCNARPALKTARAKDARPE